MQKLKEAGRLAVTILILSIVVVGCGNSNEKENQATNSMQPSSSGNQDDANAMSTSTNGSNNSKKIKIEVMGDLGTGAVLPPSKDDIILQQLNQKLNIDLQMNYSTDYTSKLNVRVAAGDAPDIFGVDKNQIDQFSKQGVLLDLAPYADKLKNVQRYLGDVWKTAFSNGEMYYIPGLPGESPNYFTYWIRQDWLDKLGLKAPTTLGELVQIATAFTFDDPDGNGKKDTYGITGQGLGAFAPIFGAYGAPIPLDGVHDEVYVENGKFTDTLQAPGMQEALTYVNGLVNDGVTDPDLLTNKAADVQKKAFQGQVGIVMIDWASMTKDDYVKDYQTVNPNAKWAQLPAIQGPYGKSNNVWDVSTTSGGHAVSKSLAKDPEKLDRILQLLDYLGTTEGSRLTMYGIEGRDYNVDGDGTVVPTDLLAQEGSYFFLYGLFGKDNQAYLHTKFEKQTSYIDTAYADPHTKVYTSGVNLPEGYNSADADRYISEEMVKFVYGKEQIDHYDTFLSTLKNQFHQDLFWSAAEDHLKEMGLIQ